jgi:ABC-type Zn uptake system ZnuABC Zn-binding protein ZnuA
MRVVASIPPLAGLVGPLLPEGSVLTVMVGPTQSAHGFELTPSQVAEARRADLVCVVGLGLDVQVERALGSGAGARIIRFSDLIGPIEPAEGEEGAGADEEDHPVGEHDHDHGPVDPHLWLDPHLARRFVVGAADAIAKARGHASPDAPLQEALAQLLQAIDDIDAEYRARLAPFQGAAIINTHDAFGRLAERYGLRIGAVIQPLGTQEPTMESLSAAAHAVSREGARAIFVEPQTSGAAARRLAEVTGVPVGALDPLGAGDWVVMMRQNLDELVRTLGASAGGAGGGDP